MSDSKNRSIIFAITFLLGVTAVVVWVAACPQFSGISVVLEDEITAAHELVRQSIKFENPDFFDGFRINSEFYVLPNGVTVRVTHENFDSPNHAHLKLQEKVTAAVTVLHREPKINLKGCQIGERVVMVSCSCMSKPEASITWTDDKTLISIESSSLSYALAYEMSL